MTADPDVRSSEMHRILADIIETMSKFEDPASFIQSLQCEIEEISGASVAFASRSAADLSSMGYLDDVDASPEDVQRVIYDASVAYDEGYSNKDHITDLLNDEISKLVSERTEEPS